MNKNTAKAMIAFGAASLLLGAGIATTGTLANASPQVTTSTAPSEPSPQISFVPCPRGGCKPLPWPRPSRQPRPAAEVAKSPAPQVVKTASGCS